MYPLSARTVATTTGDHVGIWSSPSLATLLAAPETVVWRDSDPSRNTQMWAPAFRHVGSRWYVYYTASDGVDTNHRMYVLESAGDDPLGPYSFKAKIADFGEYAIRSPTTASSTSSGPVRAAAQGGPAQLWIARMSDPWTVTGGRVAIPASGGCTEVREGPTQLYRNGRTFLTYSTCDTGKPDYQLGMKSIANGADPMVVANWVQHPGPIFSRNATGVWGPGHHSFFQSPDGTEDWIAYHGQEHQHLHLRVPDHPGAEDQLERRRHAQPRQAAGGRRHPAIAVRRSGRGHLGDQRHRPRHRPEPGRVRR
jgi:GH43 family beta-xylosidase